MKILLFTIKQEEYLSDSILHGLRRIYGSNVIDFPKKEFMYRNFDLPNNQIYGNGFTLFKTLDDIYIDRNDIENKIKNKYFDLIIFSEFSRQFKLFLKYRKYIDSRIAIILDGNDRSKLYPFHGRFWKYFPLQFLDTSYFNFLTFKREWTPKTLHYRYFIPFSNILGFLLYKNIALCKISYSVPEEKIYVGPAIKEKLFPKHIVDKGLLEKINNSSSRYFFENESDYYHDLQISKYGITTKKAGWDCMRHYEIAANGTVMCFKNLKLKPTMCAPHDLIPGYNCLNYETYEDLVDQINAISDSEYEQLRVNSINWARAKTTKNLADNLLKDFLNFRKQKD